MKRFLIALLAVAISACTVPNFSMGLPATPPAPLAQTAVDDKALETAWRSFDVALDAIDLWKAAKPSIKGTPKAIAIADGIDAVTAALTAAEGFADAASNPVDYPTALVKYRKALADAKDAMAQLRAALKGN